MTLEDMDLSERQQLEKMIFQLPIEVVEAETKDFWQSHYPKMWERAEAEPKRKSGLVAALVPRSIKSLGERGSC